MELLCSKNKLIFFLQGAKVIRLASSYRTQQVNRGFSAPTCMAWD